MRWEWGDVKLLKLVSLISNPYKTGKYLWRPGVEHGTLGNETKTQYNVVTELVSIGASSTLTQPITLCTSKRQNPEKPKKKHRKQAREMRWERGNTRYEREEQGLTDWGGSFRADCGGPSAATESPPMALHHRPAAARSSGARKREKAPARVCLRFFFLTSLCPSFSCSFRVRVSFSSDSVACSCTFWSFPNNIFDPRFHSFSFLSSSSFPWSFSFAFFPGFFSSVTTSCFNFIWCLALVEASKRTPLRLGAFRSNLNIFISAFSASKSLQPPVSIFCFYYYFFIFFHCYRLLPKG